MDVFITNRRGIEERGRLLFSEKTAVISITDANYPFAELTCLPRYWLKLAFDDVDGDVLLDELGADFSPEQRDALMRKYHMFTESQASQVAEFYRDLVRNGVETLIVQCEHGQSRSAAVAAAIREYENKNGISVFADDRYWPNKLVFRMTLKQLLVQN